MQLCESSGQWGLKTTSVPSRKPVPSGLHFAWSLSSPSSPLPTLFWSERWHMGPQRPWDYPRQVEKADWQLCTTTQRWFYFPLQIYFLSASTVSRYSLPSQMQNFTLTTLTSSSAPISVIRQQIPFSTSFWFVHPTLCASPSLDLTDASLMGSDSDPATTRLLASLMRGMLCSLTQLYPLFCQSLHQPHVSLHWAVHLLSKKEMSRSRSSSNECTATRVCKTIYSWSFPSCLHCLCCKDDSAREGIKGWLRHSPCPQGSRLPKRTGSSVQIETRNK